MTYPGPAAPSPQMSGYSGGPSDKMATRAAFVFVVVVAVAALVVSVVALARSGAMDSGSSSTTAAAPTPTAAETEQAHKNLCEQYELAARAAKIETNRDDPALARISTMNGAGLLEAAATQPALDPGDRSAALDLAAAYRTNAAVGSFARTGQPEWDSSFDDLLAKNAVMKEVCRGG